MISLNWGDICLNECCRVGEGVILIGIKMFLYRKYMEWGRDRNEIIREVVKGTGDRGWILGIFLGSKTFQ